MKREKGITLIALIITMVVLIILSGIAINMTIGENGIFTKAKYAKEEYINAESYEKERINEISEQFTGKQQLVTQIALNKTSTKIYTGKTETLTATIIPINANNKNLIWSSSDKSVAIVNNGTITAIKPGTTIITVETTDESNLSASCEVVVENEKIYLYKEGDECTNITGGWVKAVSTYSGTGEKRSNYLYCYSPIHNDVYSTYYIRTANKINLQEYKKLCFEVSITVHSNGTGWHGAYIGAWDGSSYNYNDRFLHSPSGGKLNIIDTAVTNKQIILDINNLNESLYITGGITNGGANDSISINIYKVWLEK